MGFLVESGHELRSWDYEVTPTRNWLDQFPRTGVITRLVYYDR